MKDNDAQYYKAFAERLAQRLELAEKNDGVWLNPTAKLAPMILDSSYEISPFNRLNLAMRSDELGAETNIYTEYNNDYPVKRNQKATHFVYYNWNTYERRSDPSQTITKTDYLKLPPDKQREYKGRQERRYPSLFNIDQTRMNRDRPEEYNGYVLERGTRTQAAKLSSLTQAEIKRSIDGIKDNLVPIRHESATESRYDAAKDAIYMCNKSEYESELDWVQDRYRQVAAATGNKDRLARGGLRYGARNQDMHSDYELMAEEIISAVKMLDLGLPARISKKNLPAVSRWAGNLRAFPKWIFGLESDLNMSMDMIKKAEQGIKIGNTSKINTSHTNNLKSNSKRYISPDDELILTDILASDSHNLNEGNFKSQADKRVFTDKYGLTEYFDNITHHRQVIAASTDEEVIDYGHTEIDNIALNADQHIVELLGSVRKENASRDIASDICQQTDKNHRRFAVVEDPENKRVDVVLPYGAAKNYNGRGLNKDIIKKNFTDIGYSAVRFFEPTGRLAYQPEDRYFAGKRVYTAVLDGRKISDKKALDIKDRVEQALHVPFDDITGVKDPRTGKYAFQIKLKEQPGFGVFPDNADDKHKFFSMVTAIRQPAEQREQTRAKYYPNIPTFEEALNSMKQEMVDKYAAMVEENPSTKKDVLDKVPDGVDLGLVKSAKTYKSGGLHILKAEIAGINEPLKQNIDKYQSARLFAADDLSQASKVLATVVFESRLRELQAQSKEASQTVEIIEEAEETRVGRSM